MEVNLSLRQVLEHLPLLATVTDADGRFVMVNEAYARWRQAPRHSFEGKNRRETGWPEESALAMEKEEREVRAANSPLHFFRSVVLRDGRACWLNTVRLPIRFDDNGAGGVLSIAEDMSEKVAIDEVLRGIANARAFGEQALPNMLTVLARVARAGCAAVYRDAGGLLDCRNSRGEPCEAPQLPSDRERAFGGDGGKTLIVCELPASGREKRGGTLCLRLPARAPDAGLVQKLMQVAGPVIAEEMERQAAERQFSDLFQSGPDAMLLIRSDGRIALANRQTEVLFGYSREELEGRPVEALVPVSSRAQHAALRDRFAAAPHHRSMGSADSQVTGLRRDGSTFPADISLSPLRTTGAGLITVAAVRDLTRRVEAENALRDLNASLERRIAERTVALQKEVEERSRAQSTATEAAARLEAITNGLPDIVFQLQLDGEHGRFTFISEGIAPLIGVSREEALRDASLVLKAVVPEDRARVIASINAAARLRARWSHQFRIRDRKGAVRWAEGKAQAELAPDGGHLWNGYWHDVTDRKNAEEALRRTLEEREALFEAAPSALILLREREIVRCNRHAETMFGYGRGEMIGLPARALYADAAEYQRITSELYSAPSPGELASAEAAQVRKDGTRFHAIGTRRCLTGGDVVLALTDVTAQHQLADALRSAKEAADTASRMKSSFLATVSHELRTPMNGMLGMLELLALSPLAAEQRQMLSAARESASTLLRLIDDILDLSSIENGSLGAVTFETVSLPEIVREACALHAPAAERKGLTMQSVAGEPIAPAHAADRVRIFQVLNNLLDNAVKFTDAGGIVVRLASLARDRDHEHVRFLVSDTGIGIPERDIGRLFHAFGQLDGGNSRRYGGLGIGLTLCKRIVQALDGHLEIVSKPGKGTTVMVDLRLRMRQPPPPVGAAASQTQQVPEGAPAILVVEDHPVNLKLLKRQVSMLGYECDTAAHGTEAIAKWQSGRFALVLTDCQMPGMDGFELARQIRRMEREHPGRSPTPIVACTANAFSEDVKKCLEAGMNDHLAKPVKLDALRDKLAAWAPRGAARGNAAAPAPLDPQALSQFTGGDAALEQEVLQQFLDANGGEVHVLLDAIGTGDLRQAELSAHRIKGASGMIGASMLADAAARLEQAARRADMADVRRIIGELLAHNREVRRHILAR